MNPMSRPFRREWWHLQIVRQMQIAARVESAMRRLSVGVGDIAIGKYGEMNVKRKSSGQNAVRTGIVRVVVSARQVSVSAQTGFAKMILIVALLNDVFTILEIAVKTPVFP